MRALILLVLFFCLSWSYALAQSLTKTPIKTAFSIKAVDDKTSAELPAQFRVDAQVARKRYAGQSQPGKPYVFVLERTDTLNVVASVKGYYEAEEIMVVSCDTCADYEYIVRLEKAAPAPVVAAPEVVAKKEPKPDSVFRNLQVNQAFRLDNVYFDQSSYVLRPESYPQLDKLAKTLATTPKLMIEIAGHTDNVGDRRLNQFLSENRAKVITNYLIRSGIAENRLQHRGYGDSRPAAPNDSEENKKKNRRVEFVVLAI